jgi:hypothetical protein
MADPEKYHTQAERLRQEAATTHDPFMQQTILDIAELYERMADTLTKQSPAAEDR